MTTDHNIPVKRRKRPAQGRAASRAPFKLFATTEAGLEEALASELLDLGVKSPEIRDRGVAFRGTLSTVYRANLHLRTAYRVLMELAEFDAPDRRPIQPPSSGGVVKIEEGRGFLPSLPTARCLIAGVRRYAP